MFVVALLAITPNQMLKVSFVDFLLVSFCGHMAVKLSDCIKRVVAE
jgi:hypothetical protein